MKVAKRIIVGGRILGNTILDALDSALMSESLHGCWMSSNEGNKVVIRCFKTIRKRKRVVPGISIQIVEPIVPENKYNQVIVSLNINGLVKMLFARRVLEDFETFERCFKKYFIDNPQPKNSFCLT